MGFIEPFTQPRRRTMKDLILKIDGMSCGHCVGQVTKVLTQLDGVQVKTVKVGEAVVVYDQEEITPADIARAVNDVGYEAQPAGRAT
ncbi:heavy-metal-associated domain-containing protein [Nitrospirales bacterium NOB]|nr:heavy-metal-associated domain-containing protein [Nitrospirales bacterium NOB]